MSSSAADGSEDVTDFLQRIKELGDKRDQEDEERNRKLEEEILQGRKERQARRAERARSISPTKSSPSNTPTSSRTFVTQASNLSKALSPTIDPERGFAERRDIETDDAMERPRASFSLTKENSPPDNGGLVSPDATPKRDISVKASPSSAMPSRSSTLSWQRRPNSQSSELPRSRPLSMVATENAARSPRTVGASEPTPASTLEDTPSREQIAQSLGSKDPSWFRQTADRGLNSPAYRRNQVEAEERSDHGSNSVRVQMPGMSHETSEPEKSLDDASNRSSYSRSSFSSASGPRNPETTSTSSGSIGSPMPSSSAHRFEPPNVDSASEVRSLAMSPSQGRISPERLDRPLSPTKGMGGFVQSAMMKRSDSVNKRWSVQSPSGLSRGNSMASNRNSNDPNPSHALGSVVNASASMPRPSSLSRDNSPRPSSRPTSSHSNSTVTQDAQRPGSSSSMRSTATTSTKNDTFIKPSLPASRSQTPGNIQARDSPSDVSASSDAALPVSPSKTMEPRRWSPTKSSWLESALNKPDSPKPKAAPPQQPAWMSEINKAKQKGSVDLSSKPAVGHKHEVSIGGLMRSPPLGGPTKPLGISGLPAGFSSSVISKGRSESIDSQASISLKKPDPAAVASLTPRLETSPTDSNKPKPEALPKKDFRAGLKPRQPLADNGKVSEPEFKNVFGQLRRTKTQNYVAPDELKDNITQGKAALNITGGPKKTERKDEFKDAILKKKDDFKKAQLEGKGVSRSANGESQETSLPEALAKRKALGRSGSIVAETGPPKSTNVVPLKESSGPQAVRKEALGGKLAGRMNPALAGLLARGPPSAASETSRSSSPAFSQRTISMSTSTTSPEESGPQLTHMTKGRARGPRRKAPSTAPTTVATSDKITEMKLPKSPDPESQSPTVPRLPKSEPTTSDKDREKQLFNTPKQPPYKPSTLQTPTKWNEVTEPLPEGPVTKIRPAAPTKSPSLSPKPRGTPFNIQQVDSPETAKLRPLPLSQQKSSVADNLPKAAPTQPRSPIPQSKTQDTRNEDRQSPSSSVRGAAASWGRPSTSTANTGARFPIKLPTQDDEKAIMIEAGLRSPSPVKGSTTTPLDTQNKSQSASSRPLPTPPIKPSSPSSAPTTWAAKPSPPIPQSSEALLLDFFEKHEPPPEFLADTAAILAARDEQVTEVKTLRSSLHLLSSDGKKQLVPAHHERLLFEGNLYLCVHAFGNAAGKKVTEVYFWAGDEVPSSTVVASTIFAEKEAKAAGGRLVKMRQGMETPGFFQALGGIIIIRRGLSSKYDSLAPHILCGRKHLGQIAFDEVDYSPASLCSGFPYLISTQSAKCYLWKGKGSGVDELSCARLIGIDFGLTGEIEEVEDGKEPASFLSIFGDGARIPKSADHWRVKPNYSKYSGRLFRADPALSSPIVEISPFSQRDVSPSGIYILDAFFEIYVIVGSRAKSRMAPFHNALTFAQEYAILAAGMEDRPYVPVTTVVLEGIPKDMKSVFRKWRDELAPTITQQAGNLQRGRSLRVLPLTAALEATRRR